MSNYPNFRHSWQTLAAWLGWLLIVVNYVARENRLYSLSTPVHEIVSRDRSLFVIRTQISPHGF
jgi:hypothetical protein